VADRDDAYLWRLRAIAAFVLLGLIACAALADTFGRLFIDSSFHADTAIIGSLLGGLLLMLGLEIPAMLRRRKDD
jgi:uncharacterized integral membrane protein